MIVCFATASLPTDCRGKADLHVKPNRMHDLRQRRRRSHVVRSNARVDHTPQVGSQSHKTGLVLPARTPFLQTEQAAKNRLHSSPDTHTNVSAEGWRQDKFAAVFESNRFFT